MSDEPIDLFTTPPPSGRLADSNENKERTQSSHLAEAREYHDRGWPPVPLPPGQKKSPPTGLTGWDGVDLTAEEIETVDWSGNIGLRMPADVIGIDVDAYNGGLVTLGRLEAKHGELPLTFCSHSQRNDSSMILFFQVPAGRSWVSALPGIEIIQRHHRYAAVWPSIHPEGRSYQWWDQTIGETAEVIPRVDDLPFLPVEWVAALSRDWGLDDTHAHAVEPSEADAFVVANTTADAPGYLGVIVKEFESEVAKGVSRHATMAHCAIWAMEMVAAGVLAGPPTVERLKGLWESAMSDPAKRQATPGEFSDMVRHAVGKAKAKDEEVLWHLRNDIVGPKMIPSAPATAVLAETPTAGWRGLILDGRSWLRSGSTTVETVWGDSTDALVPRLQPTLIVGETGAGKTTLAQHLILGTIGLPGYADILGWPVAALPEGERVLYLAADRPDQARLAMLRLLKGGDEEAWRLVAERLAVWQGPPPESLAHSPRLLLEMAEEANAAVMVVDSTKDMAEQLSDDRVGAAVNQAHQLLVASGRDVVALHHPRKRGREHAADRPTLDDVYGSAWIVNGSGSVLFLIDEPSSTEVVQLKTPNGRQANFRFQIDSATGTLTSLASDQLLAQVAAGGAAGISTKQLAVAVFGVADPTEAQVERVRRRLKVLEATGSITTTGTAKATRWVEQP
jgi:hypothetical protein